MRSTFDGTIVSEERPYNDLITPLEMMPGARDALLALKAAGHLLVLWSARSNRAGMYLAEFDPLVRAGKIADARTDATRELHAARYRQMLEFVERELPGVFDAVDDGRCGKIYADLYIDNKALGFNRGVSWPAIARTYGD